MRLTSTLALLGLLAAPALAQHSREVWLPVPSPRATVSQQLVATTVSVDYGRPGVNGRTVWGSLVPWGEVWRTGADVNTRITFSTDVTVAGQPVAAGAYGLHTIPVEKGPWTLILSRDADAWGSFAYDQSRDALRVEIAPRAHDMVEDLSFAFDGLGEDSMTLAMRWEKLELPIEIGVDPVATTVASLEHQLTGLPQFFPSGWSDAARYCLDNGCLDKATVWIERSLGIQETFDGLAVKAEILEATGKPAEAKVAREKAFEIGDAGQIHQLGRTLLGAGKKAEALAVFEKNAALHPDSWIPFVGLARGRDANGDFAGAAKAMRRAIELAPEGQTAYLTGLAERLEKGESIN